MASWLDKVSSLGGEAYQAVGSWSWLEDDEPAPDNAQTQAAKEKLAEGSVIPKVQTAQNATGATIPLSVTASPLAQYAPYIAGGAVLVVVLVVFAMMMGRK